MNLVHYIKYHKIKCINLNNNDLKDEITMICYKVKVPEIYNLFYSDKINEDLLNDCIKKIFLLLKNNDIVTEIDLID